MAVSSQSRVVRGSRDSRPDSQAEGVTSIMHSPTALEAYFLQLVNETRTKAGVQRLTFDGELLAAADGHSAWMDQNDKLTHTGENSTTAGYRVTMAGYGYVSIAENIGYVSGPLNEATVLKLHETILKTPTYYANTIRAQYEEIGIGLKAGTIYGEDVVFVTLNFGTPDDQERAEPDDIGPTVPDETDTGGSNVIAGTSQDDVLYGTSGDNLIYGYAGHDVIHGLGGIDLMYGGMGNDTYYVEQTGDKAIERGGEGNDSVYSSITYSLYGQVVENLTLTGSADIDGTGNTLHNRLTGNAGANVLDGGALNDILNGRAGKDVLIGGSGSDTFLFETERDAQGDTIIDFEHGLDRINLSLIDANQALEGNQAFTFIGTERFHNVAGELHVYHLSDGNTYISADGDGNGIADLAIKVLGWHTFTGSDFVL